MAQAAVGRPRYDGTPNHRMAIEVRDETGPVLQRNSPSRSEVAIQISLSTTGQTEWNKRYLINHGLA